MSLKAAQLLVPKSKLGLVITQDDFITEDIIELYLERAKEDFSYLRPWIKQMGWKSEKDLPSIYDWVYKNITYVDDTKYYGDDWQIIKSPAEVIHSAKADCKSLSLLLKAILDNLKEPVAHTARFVWYTWQDYYKHVYLIAILKNGLKRPLDTVYATESGRNKYGREIRQIKHTIDYTFEANKNMPLAKLGKIDQNESLSDMTEGQLSLKLRQRELDLINKANKSEQFNQDINLLERARISNQDSEQLGCSSSHFLCEEINQASVNNEPARKRTYEDCIMVEMPSPHQFPPLFQNSPEYKIQLQAYEDYKSNCKAKYKEQDELILQKLEDCAPSLIQAFTEEPNEANQIIKTLAQTAGLSEQNTTQILRNGILNATLRQPEEILKTIPTEALSVIEKQGEKDLTELVTELTKPSTPIATSAKKLLLDAIPEFPSAPIDEQRLQKVDTLKAKETKKIGWLYWLIAAIIAFFGIRKLSKS